MKQFLFLSLTFYLFLSTSFLQAQDLMDRINAGEPVQHQIPPNRIAETIGSLQETDLFVETELFHLNQTIDKNDYSDAIEGAVFLDLDREFLQNFRSQSPQNIHLSIPVSIDKNLQLNLTQVQIKKEDFRIKTSDGVSHYDMNNPEKNIFYRGIVEGDGHSLVVLTVFRDAVRILVADIGGNYIIGKLGDSPSYIFYNENKAKIDLNLPGMCETEDLPSSHSQPINSNTGGSSDPGDCVNVYVEADFKIYQDQGSNVIGVQNYVEAIFNEVIAEFANAGVTMYVSEIYVWTSSDPYAGDSSTSTILSDFVSNTPTFNGDLAHFITSRPMGGIAYRPGICTSVPYGVSGGLTTGNPGNLALSSSTFVRVAHELGHNLNLRHTHSCAWNGNNTQIDDCGNIWTENNGDPTPSCYDTNNPIIPPSGGGTIMSYCHVTSTGRNLANGFTEQGNTVLQTTIANSSCLNPNCISPLEPDDVGIITVIDPVGTFCSGVVEPLVTLYNFGSNTVSIVVINYTIDGQNPTAYTWTGNLGSGESTTVSLSTIFVNDGLHVFNVSTESPNGNPDSNSNNDSNASNFSTFSNGQSITLALLTDNYGYETTWDIRDTSNVIQYTGGGAGYPNDSLILERLCLSQGCYTFTIYDSYGDGICCAYGEGNYFLENLENNNIYVSGGFFESLEQTSFCLQEVECETDIILSNIVGQDTYNASNCITSDGLIQSNSIHVFQAENCIDLLPGFEVEPNCDFSGEIAPCPFNETTIDEQ